MECANFEQVAIYRELANEAKQIARRPEPTTNEELAFQIERYHSIAAQLNQLLEAKKEKHVC